jgi:ABC-type nitrate/sulfonate/bicarbonate transport system substrate-binding protein
MDKIHFPYRSYSHLTLLHVVAESGAWEKQGLDVEYDKYVGSSDAHTGVLKGDVEFISGNHITTYAKRARGDQWVYLGQTLNSVNNSLVVHPDSGINGVQDLREKVVGSRGHHPHLNDWIYLKQHGLDHDRGDIQVIDTVKYDRKSAPSNKTAADLTEIKAGTNIYEEPPLWMMVKNREVDACLVAPPISIMAKKAGLKVIDIEPLPMIYFTTLSTGLPFAKKHPEIVERFIKGMIEGIHFFKTQPEKSIEIIQRKFNNDGQLTMQEAKETYEHFAPRLEAKLYPTMAAISNVYQEAVHLDKDALRINPMELWDLHYLRQIDDSGFTDQLYGNTKKK